MVLFELALREVLTNFNTITPRNISRLNANVSALITSLPKGRIFFSYHGLEYAGSPELYFKTETAFYGKESTSTYRHLHGRDVSDDRRVEGNFSAGWVQSGLSIMKEGYLFGGSSWGGNNPIGDSDSGSSYTKCYPASLPFQSEVLCFKTTNGKAYVGLKTNWGTSSDFCHVEVNLNLNKPYGGLKPLAGHKNRTELKRLTDGYKIVRTERVLYMNLPKIEAGVGIETFKTLYAAQLAADLTDDYCYCRGELKVVETAHADEELAYAGAVEVYRTIFASGAVHESIGCVFHGNLDRGHLSTTRDSYTQLNRINIF